ncbi:hypothetical protein ACLOJK_012387 [Asimina triloba]
MHKKAGPVGRYRQFQITSALREWRHSGSSIAVAVAVAVAVAFYISALPSSRKSRPRNSSSSISVIASSSIAVAVAVAVASSIAVAVFSYISAIVSSSPISILVSSNSVVIYSSISDRRFLLSSPSSSSSFVLWSLHALPLLRLVSSPPPALSNVSYCRRLSPGAVSYRRRLLSQHCLLLSASPLRPIPRSKHPIATIFSVLVLPSLFSTLPARLQLFLTSSDWQPTVEFEGFDLPFPHPYINLAMNPLTLVKRIQKINSTEAALGVSEDASWHAKYKESAYVFVGGIPFDLTEGDLLAVFAQGEKVLEVGIEGKYGEIVDVNLVRDKATGKSKGFAFLAYDDQRSTILAVDNLNGAKLLGRIIRVDHVSNYKKKEEEDEEKEQEKREARGVCYAFQRGECNRGAACKFSHNEQRSANTGWGDKDNVSRWGHDKYEGPSKRMSDNLATDPPSIGRVGEESKSSDNDGFRSRKESKDGDRRSHLKHSEPAPKDLSRKVEKRWDKHEEEKHGKKNWDRQEIRKSSRRHEFEQAPKEDRDSQRTQKRSRYDETHDRPNRKDDKKNEKDRTNERVVRDRGGNEKWSRYNEDEDMDKRGSEKRSRHDEDEERLNRKEDRDKTGSQKRSRSVDSPDGESQAYRMNNQGFVKNACLEGLVDIAWNPTSMFPNLGSSKKRILSHRKEEEKRFFLPLTIIFSRSG